MAKRATTKKAAVLAEQSGEAESTTYSTRFTRDQRQAIDTACFYLNWPPARFIRDASVRRAVEVLNSTGPARHHLAGLAGLVAKQLLGKRGLRQTMGIGEARGIEDEIIKIRPSYSDLDDFLEGEAGRIHGHWTLTVNPLDDEDAKQIKLAMQSSPAEFVRLVLEHWELSEQGKDFFECKVNASDLLSGNNNDEQQEE